MTSNRKIPTTGSRVVRQHTAGGFRENKGSGLASNRSISDLDRIKSNPRLAVELSAATLSTRIQSALTAAFEARPDITQKVLADKLSVSESRVSQVLKGEESPRITTIARYLRALGYELRVKPVPVDAGAPEISTGRRRHRAAPALAAVLYESVVTHKGTDLPAYTILPEGVDIHHRTVGVTRRIGMIDYSKTSIRIKPSGARSFSPLAPGMAR